MLREIQPKYPKKNQEGSSVATAAEVPITREIPTCTQIKDHHHISQTIFEHKAPITKFEVSNGNIYFTDSDGRFYYLDQDHKLHTLNKNIDTPTHTFKIDTQTKEIISAEGNSIVSRQLDNNRSLSKKTLVTMTPPKAERYDHGWGHISAIELTPDKIYYIFSLIDEMFSLDRNSGEKESISTKSNLLTYDNFTIFPNGKAVIGGAGSRSSIIDIMGREPNVFLEGMSSSRVTQKSPGNIIFNGSALGSIHRWSIDAPDKPILVGHHSGSITDILVSRKSESTTERVISTDNIGEIYLWQATDARCEKYQGTLIAKLKDSVRGILFDKDGNITCAAGKKILQLT